MPEQIWVRIRSEDGYVVLEVQYGNGNGNGPFVELTREYMEASFCHESRVLPAADRRGVPVEGDCCRCYGLNPLLWCNSCEDWFCRFCLESHDHETYQESRKRLRQVVKNSFNDSSPAQGGDLQAGF